MSSSVRSCGGPKPEPPAMVASISMRLSVIETSSPVASLRGALSAAHEEVVRGDAALEVAAVEAERLGHAGEGLYLARYGRRQRTIEVRPQPPRDAGAVGYRRRRIAVERRMRRRGDGERRIAARVAAHVRGQHALNRIARMRRGDVHGAVHPAA